MQAQNSRLERRTIPIWCEVRQYQANGPDRRLYAPYTVTRITDAKWVKARPQHGKADKVIFTGTFGKPPA